MKIYTNEFVEFKIKELKDRYEISVKHNHSNADLLKRELDEWEERKIMYYSK